MKMTCVHLLNHTEVIVYNYFKWVMCIVHDKDTCYLPIINCCRLQLSLYPNFVLNWEARGNQNLARSSNNEVVWKIPWIFLWNLTIKKRAFIEIRESVWTTEEASKVEKEAAISSEILIKVVA